MTWSRNCLWKGGLPQGQKRCRCSAPTSWPSPGATLFRRAGTLGHSLTLWHSRGLTKCWRGCGPSLPCWVELRLRTSVRCCHCTSSRRPGSSPGGVPSVCTSEVRSWTRGHRVCCLRSEPVPGREHGRPQAPGPRSAVPPGRLQEPGRVASNGRFCQKSSVCSVFLGDSREAQVGCSRHRGKVTALSCSAQSPFQGNASRAAGLRGDRGTLFSAGCYTPGLCPSSP